MDAADYLMWLDMLEEEGQDTIALRAALTTAIDTPLPGAYGTPPVASDNPAYGDSAGYGYGYASSSGDGHPDGDYSHLPDGDGWGDGEDAYPDGDGFGCGLEGGASGDGRGYYHTTRIPDVTEEN